MRESGGFFYALVIVGEAVTLANLYAKAEATRVEIVSTIAAIVLLAEAWLLRLPIVIGVAIVLVNVLVLYLMRSK